MYICLCGPVNDATIRAAIHSGARTVASVGRACGAGVQCGKCRVTIARMIDIETASSGTTRAAEPVGPKGRGRWSEHG